MPVEVGAQSALAGDGAKSFTTKQLVFSGSQVGPAPDDGVASRATDALNVAHVVRTATPDTTLPTASLYGLNPGPGSALVTTDNAFTHGQTTVSSDALIALLGGPGGPAGPGGAAAGGSSDPAYSADLTLKRLGDGWYEQRLINEQVAKLTGYRYLDGFSNDADQYAALINAGATFAKRYQLVPGVALTAAQMAQLTSDIVWLVAENVTLPDGSTQRVLVPQVYVRVQPGDIDGSGSLLSGNTLNIKGSGDLVNHGSLAGRNLVAINADNVSNLAGGRITGGSVLVTARNDLNVIGSSIDAKNAAVLTAGHDINIESTTRTDTMASGWNTHLDRVAGLYVTNPGGTLVASAGNDVNLVGAVIASQGAGGSASVKAGHDIKLGTVSVDASSMSFSSSGYQAAAVRSDVGSRISSAGALSLSAGNDINARAATVDSIDALEITAKRDINLTEGHALVAAQFGSVSSSSRNASVLLGSATADTALATSLSGGSVKLDAGRDLVTRGVDVTSAGALNIKAGRDVDIGVAEGSASFGLSMDTSHRGTLKNTSNSLDIASEATSVRGSSLHGQSVSIQAGNDAIVTGSSLYADDALSIHAGRDVRIEAAEASGTFAINQTSSRTPSGLAQAIGGPLVGIAVATLTPPDPTSAGLLTRIKNGTTTGASASTAIGSTVSAGSIDIHSDRDTTISGSTLVADHDVVIDAGRDLTIKSAQSTQDTLTTTGFQGSGNLGSFFDPSVGRSRNSSDQNEHDVTQVRSSVGSLNGNVTLRAGGTYTQTASDVVALAPDADGTTTKGGNIDITAKNVIINEAYDSQTTTGSRQGSQLTLGGTASVPLYNAITSTISSANAVGSTGDRRIQALGAATTAYSAYNVASTLAQGGNFGGFKAGAALTSSSYQSTDDRSNQTVVGSTISGNGNVSITATGAGANSSIHAIGATIDAGYNVSLTADSAITLESGQDTTRTSGSNHSSSASIGASYSVGSQNGVTIDLGASSGRGTDSGNEVRQYNTYVTAGNTVTMHSGGDTALRGAVVSGERVEATVGGNLTVESRQDTNVQATRQNNAGGSASLCIYPICYGAPVTASVNGGAARATGNYASVVERSAIEAGDKGFDVKVSGSTNLVGGAIASTQAAVDGKKNSFESTGGLTTSDIVNVDVGRANGYSVGLSYSSGYTDAQGNSVGASSTTPSVGIGHASSGTQVSITTAGVSGVSGTDGRAGNGAVRTGDASAKLVQGWNLGALSGDVAAQVRITADFGQTASSAWGKYANSKFVDAVARGDQEAAGCWAPEGACRAGGHIIIGGLGGGAGGAVGAGLSSVAAPEFAAFLRANDVPEGLVNAIAVATATAAGGAIGGANGAAGALNEGANNFVFAAPLIVEALVAAGEAVIIKCASSPKCVGVIGGYVLSQLLPSSVPIANPGDSGYGAGSQPNQPNNTGNTSPGPENGGTPPLVPTPPAASGSGSSESPSGNPASAAGTGYGGGHQPTVNPWTFALPPNDRTAIDNGLDLVMGGAPTVTRPGTNVMSEYPNGTREDADRVFDSLPLNQVIPTLSGYGPGRSGLLPDGTRVTVRPSQDGRPTIDIRDNNRSSPRTVGEIRFGSK